MLFDSNPTTESDYITHRHFLSEARRSLMISAYIDGRTSESTPRAYARRVLRGMANACLGLGNDQVSQILYDLYYMMMLEIESAFSLGRKDNGDKDAEAIFRQRVEDFLQPKREIEDWQKEELFNTLERTRPLNNR